MIIIVDYSEIGDVRPVAVNYKRLWILLIERNMKKKDLQKLAGISPSTIAKLGRNENTNTRILSKICLALDCEVSDIIEITQEINN